MDTSKSCFADSEAAETAFYDAFSRCDLDAMRKLWADDEVVCVHPGQQALLNYDTIIRSWSHIFSGAGFPKISTNILTRTVSEKLAVHVLEEHISAESGTTPTIMLATNIYRYDKIGWLLMEHHASAIYSQSRGQTVQ